MIVKKQEEANAKSVGANAKSVGANAKSVGANACGARNKKSEEMCNVEIERKWLIEKKNLPKDYNKYPSTLIEQAYLIKTPSLRIRKSGDKYYINIKNNSSLDGLKRDEYETVITKKDYNYLIKYCQSNIIKKRRYKIPYQKYTIELDIFSGIYKGLIYAEVEFDSIKEAKKFKAPDWFGKELTGDKNSTNAALAFKKFKNKS